MTAMSAVQALYEICRASFDGHQPGPEAVERVCEALDNIKCSDLGLEDEEKHVSASANGRRSRLPSTLARVAPAITYLHLYECDKFSMGIFCLPQSAVIPLHNHPGMTVFSKLLYGSMHVKSYDWVDPSDERLNADPSISRLAKPVKDHVLTAPCETSILHPTSGGNIHSFTAVTSCAVLDVLAPPYSSTDGRQIIYYRVSSTASSTSSIEVSSSGQEPPIRRQGSNLKKKTKGKKSPPVQLAEASSSIIRAEENGEEQPQPNLVYLEEFRPPKDFVVQPGNYKGPMVIPVSTTVPATTPEITTTTTTSSTSAPAPQASP